MNIDTTDLSLQEVLKEKQNHIEQLLKEKDLDRQEAANQATLFQKDINEVGNRNQPESVLGIDNLLVAGVDGMSSRI